MTTLISPRFLKQVAKKLKKGLGISHHEALDGASKMYGYSNYRHYLNILENSMPAKKVVLKNVSKKIQVEIPFCENSQISFNEQLDILKLFQNSDDMQSTCSKWNLMKEEMQSALFNEFLTEEGEYEIQFRYKYYIAKEISLSDLEYEIKGDTLCVDGGYDLKIKFDISEFEIPDHYKDEPHFKDRVLSGSFGIVIDRNKKITMPHLNIIEIMDGIVYAGTLKPTARVIPAFSLE
jgi:hypothetical protein